MKAKRLILMLLVMLGSVTGAWAGSGTGTKDDPFTGEWKISEIVPLLKSGSYLSLNCKIYSTDGTTECLTFEDSHLLDERQNHKTPVLKCLTWTVGDSMSLSVDENRDNMAGTQNSREQMVVIDHLTRESNHLRLTGHFTSLTANNPSEEYSMPASRPEDRIRVKTKDGKVFFLDANEYSRMTQNVK